MADTCRIEVVNWDRFQHYKDRSPPWIKLHRSVLDSRQWAALDGDASKLLVECWLVASESDDGSWEGDLDDLAWRLRRTSDQLTTSLQDIAAQGLIRLRLPGASAMLATCSPEERRGEGETEAERETETETEESVQLSPEQRWTEEFEEDFWTRYPKRAGNRGKKRARSAYRARRREGVDSEKILDAATRYFKFCEVTGKLGNETVMMAATFLNDPENFDNPWTAPKDAKPSFTKAPPPSPGSQAAQVRNEKPRQEGERTGKLTLVGKDQTEQEERRAKIDAWKRENAEKLDELRDTAVREMELALTAFGRKPEVAQRLVETKVDEMIWNQKLQGAA